MCTSVPVRACPCEKHDIRANLHGRCTDVHGRARIFLLAPALSMCMHDYTDFT